jgi:hypothetical protein
MRKIPINNIDPTGNKYFWQAVGASLVGGLAGAAAGALAVEAGNPIAAGLVGAASPVRSATSSSRRAPPGRSTRAR